MSWTRESWRQQILGPNAPPYDGTVYSLRSATMLFARQQYDPDNHGSFYGDQFDEFASDRL